MINILEDFQGKKRKKTQSKMLYVMLTFLDLFTS